MFPAPRTVLPRTVRVALQIPFRPSLLHQTPVREPVPLLLTPLDRSFPAHRRKQPRFPRAESTFRARTRFHQSLSSSVAAQPDGLLRHETIIYSLFPMHVGMRQYWRDANLLLAWTRSDPHRQWWQNFLA